jgi:hypothetical protein
LKSCRDAFRWEQIIAQAMHYRGQRACGELRHYDKVVEHRKASDFQKQ